MPKRKRGSGKGKPRNGAPSYHRDFKPRTASERAAALEPFPASSHAAASRRDMLLATATSHHALDRPSLTRSGVSVSPAEALDDLDDPRLYKPAGRSETKLAQPKPRDALDWLANVPEEGQTFEDYVSFLTTRVTGRLRPIANAEGEDIVLLPIVGSPAADADADATDDDGAAESWWPAHGPPLDGLVAYTRAFYDRRVEVLPPAVIVADGAGTQGARSKGGRKAKAAATAPGAFAAASKGRMSIRFPSARGGALSPRLELVGRSDPKTGRRQILVESLLEELAAFRENRGPGGYGCGGLQQRSFCVVGVTMEDLYDGPRDLFCAGMAFGGSKVAVFSFHRYHPHLRMHPLHWHHYGYHARAGSHSYYDDDDQDPAGLGSAPPEWAGMTEKGRAELLRRCSKLLVHEIGHLYGLAHCVHNRCNMMGTGHLVEDFAAPCHPCGICLRKLQWRLGFKVSRRYELVGEAFRDMGLVPEAKWAERQARALVPKTGKGQNGDAERGGSASAAENVIDLVSP